MQIAVCHPDQHLAYLMGGYAILEFAGIYMAEISLIDHILLDEIMIPEVILNILFLRVKCPHGKIHDIGAALLHHLCFLTGHVFQKFKEIGNIKNVPVR